MKKRLNIDPRYNPWTTWPGIIMFTIGMFLYVGDYIMVFSKPINNWVNIPMIALGALLIVAKDQWVKVVTSALNRMFKKLFA